MIKLVWHYTTQEHAVSIVNDGLLKPRKDPSDITKAVLWFSKQQFWEPTASKMVSSDGLWAADFGVAFAMNIQYPKAGIIRFGIKYPNDILLSWEKYKKETDKSRLQLSILENTAAEVCAKPSDWLVTCNDIPLSIIGRIEKFNGTSYEDISADELKMIGV